MSFIHAVAAAITLSIITLQVHAHGVVSGIVIDEVYFKGYLPSFQFQSPPPKVIGWSSPADLDTGYVAPDAYNTPDIICHKGATPGQISATVQAGSSITLEWTPWPSSHHGPVTDYLANCHGPCETVDKTKLKFFKIDEAGLFDENVFSGNWASDKLIANNNSWAVTIPSEIAPGNYVLRQEIIALHSAYDLDGAQSYPQCINLKITGRGVANPEGIPGTALYKETDPGIKVNIYQSLSTYIIPGPTVYSGGSGPTTNMPSSTTSQSDPPSVTVMVTATTTSATPLSTASADNQPSIMPSVTVVATIAVVPVAPVVSTITVTEYSCPGSMQILNGRVHARDLGARLADSLEDPALYSAWDDVGSSKI